MQGATLSAFRHGMWLLFCPIVMVGALDVSATYQLLPVEVRVDQDFACGATTEHLGKREGA